MSNRRARTQAVMKRRYKLFKHLWSVAGLVDMSHLIPGKFKKWNGACGCKMYRVRYNRAKEKRKERDQRFPDPTV